MKFSRTLALAITIILTLSSSSFGDELQVGQRIKVKIDTVRTETILLFIKYNVKESRSITGEVVSSNKDTITIIDDNWKGEVRHLLKSGIKQLFVADGKKRGTWVGTKIGVFFGAIGAAIAFLPTKSRDSTVVLRNQIDRNEFAIRSLTYCTLTGTIIGYFCKVDRWKEIDRKSWNVGLAIDPTDNALNLRLSFTF